MLKNLITYRLSLDLKITAVPELLVEGKMEDQSIFGMIQTVMNTNKSKQLLMQEILMFSG